MASRVNTKFILIIVCLGFIVAGTVGGLLFLKIRGDASRQVRLAEVLLDQGNAEAASRHLGRAVRLDPGNLEYLRMYESALRDIRPETGDAARTQYGRLLTAMRQEAQFNASNAQSHLRLIEELFANARLMTMISGAAAQRAHWEQVASAAETMLSAVDENDPDYDKGKLYRGIAYIRMRATLNENDLNSAERDLEAFVEANPTHDFGWASLAEARSLLAEHWRTIGTTRTAAERREKVAPTMQQAIEAVPEGPVTNRVWLQYLLIQHRNDPAAVEEYELLAAAHQAADLARQSDDPWHVVEVSQTLQASGLSSGRTLARELYLNYVERHPNAHTHRYFMGMLDFIGGNLESASEAAETIMSAQPLPTSFLSQMQLTLRRLAASLMVDIEIQRHSQAMTDGEEVALTEVKAARDRLATFVIDTDSDPQLMQADAKIAMLENRYEVAAAGFERLIREGLNDPQLLIYSAYCLEQIGQIGLAYERTVTALENRASNTFLLFRKARLEYLLARFDDAAETIDRYLAIEPDHINAINLAQSIAARRAGETVNPDDPAAMAINAARQAAEAGELETARATIAAAMAEGNEDDSRLLDIAARLAISSGDTDQARQHIARALELQPDSRHFRQMRAVVETGDPVKAAEQFAEAEYSDEGERAVMLAVTLGTIGLQQAQLADRYESEGNAEAAATSRDVAQRATTRSEQQLEAAQRLAPNNAQLIEYRFSRALRNENWSEAETLANRARDLNLDQARGLIYRGRMEVQRQQFDQAVRSFQQATEVVPFSSQAWRGLALSYQRLGNLREAQRAFEQAYRSNPNDIGNVKAYLQLLAQMGEFPRASRVAENAYRLRPNDVELREAWLEIEAQQANLPVVIPIRREIYEKSPEDRNNAMRLAMLLGQSEPMVELILAPDGSRQYSERRWTRLSVQEQRQALNELRVAWHREADQILAGIVSRDGQDISTVSLRAILQRQRGDIPGGERVLREYIAGQEEDERTARMYLTLAQYLVEVGRYQEAYNEFLQSREYQNPQRLEGDRALGDFLFSRGAFTQAIEAYDRVLAVGRDYSLELRVSEALMSLDRYEEAAERLEYALRDRPVDYVGSMLQAMIAHGQATKLYQQGRESDADARFAAYRQALDTAERLMPTNPSPHVVRARMLLRDYQRTNQRSLLNDALSSLSRADAVRSGDRQVSLVRIEVLSAMGNTTGALAEARRLVDQSPDNIEFRQMLVQMHANDGNFNAAINVLQQGIERQPTAVIWHELKGSVQVAANNMPAAAAAFRRAFELGESVASLGRYIGTMMNSETPDYATIANMLRTVPEHLQNEPLLEASYAVALHKTGRRELSREHLRRSFIRQKQLIGDELKPENEMSSWYQVLGPILDEMQPREIEQLVYELSENQPGPFDLLWVARRWMTLGDEGISRATELLSRAVDMVGDQDANVRAGIQFELSNYYLQAKQYEAAVTGYGRVLRVSPDHAPSMNNMAFILANYLDRASEALPHAQRAAELMPNDASVLDTLGWVHYKLGNYTQAEDLLRRSIDIDETAASQLHLAQVLMAVGEFDNALIRLRRAGELQPDSEMQAEIDRLTDDIRTNRAEAR